MFTQGHKKLGGRPVGGANKTTIELKNMILAALDEAGGPQYLATQAVENPVAFLTLLGKLLPTRVAASIDEESAGNYSSLTTGQLLDGIAMFKKSEQDRAELSLPDRLNGE